MPTTIPGPTLKPITNSHFRANPSYQLIAFQDLPIQEQQHFSQLTSQTDFYGLLYPLATQSLGVKSVCHQTAELYSRLRTPGPLPESILKALGKEANQMIAQLVLDSVIEIDTGDGFIGGASAHSVIYDVQAKEATLNRTTELSYAALCYAQSLNLQESYLLSSRLYLYNRIPASPYWQLHLGDTRAVKDFLGIQPSSPIQNILNRHWHQHETSANSSAWLSWSSQTASLENTPASPTYKLYISPTCEALPDTFRRLIPVLTEMTVPHFKVGQDIYGLLRPDKIVAYFRSFQALKTTAQRLSTILSNLPAQGVPFTSAWDPDGLLSWGIDPPRAANTSLWSGQESWRLWVTNQLAVALLAAQRDSQRTVAPWRFALDRLSLNGIDISSWTPKLSLWQNSPIIQK